jgi:hypothetical protein
VTDNAALANALLSAGCDPDRFGYWWKWFPERVRPDAPEWVLDGDMVIVGKPSWFDAWRTGNDRLRVTQDDRSTPEGIYGEYHRLDLQRRLYSGLISLQPGHRYMDNMLNVLGRQPLGHGHDGQQNMSEQGVIAATFDSLAAEPIPLYEFPFGRAFEDFIDFGLKEPQSHVWGYHFGNAFRRENPHFTRLIAEGVVDWRDIPPSQTQRFAWMRNNRGQWGREGWSMHPVCVDRISDLAQAFSGRPVLEIGTSRGYLTAVLVGHGCRMTTVDHEDRGARQNLDGLAVEIIRGEAFDIIANTDRRFAMIVADLHGNSVAVWRKLWPVLRGKVEIGGTIVLYNSHLWKIPEWREETGLRWLADTGMPGFKVEMYEDPLPGMMVCQRA